MIALAHSPLAHASTVDCAPQQLLGSESRQVLLDWREMATWRASLPRSAAPVGTMFLMHHHSTPEPSTCVFRVSTATQPSTSTPSYHGQSYLENVFESDSWFGGVAWPFPRTNCGMLSVGTVAARPSARSTIFEELKPSFKISYVDGESIAALLGSRGENVLNTVLRIVAEAGVESHWPLAGVDVKFTRDHEVAKWEYVLVCLLFDSTFDEADSYLRDLYPRLDALARGLGREDRSVLEELIYFDVKSTRLIQGG